MLYNPKWKKRQKPDSEVYDRAADAIQDRGHSIGLLVDKDGRMCLWGAISFALTGNPLERSRRSVRLINRLHPLTGGYSPIHWNNAQGTKEKVVNLLRKAARGANQKCVND